MKIAVLSGKGGTGKTLIAVNLAAVSAFANTATTAIYIDCDVEEPNGHLFFKPNVTTIKDVTVKIPVVNKELCTGCRKCVDFCKFNALAFVKEGLIVFDDICHSCGGCILVCPEDALTERDKPIGKIEIGQSENTIIHSGIMNTGIASGVPIINELLNDLESKEESILIESILIDCPPGSACVVMESIKDADYCVLVAEPTVFGAHNLSMVYELVKLFGKPHGVVLNKCLDGVNPSEEFCKANNIKILGSIPFDNELGKMNSNAQIVARESEKYRTLFLSLLEKIKEEVRHETALNN